MLDSKGLDCLRETNGRSVNTNDRSVNNKGNPSESSERGELYRMLLLSKKIHILP